MILGIGTDLCDIDRITASIDRHGRRFVDRLFTVGEQNLAQTASDQNRFYAGRFAAKEACVKALGTGINEAISWLDLEVIREASGKPSLRLGGGALAHLNSMLDAKTLYRTHLSLSYEGQIAQAFVVIEAQ